MSIGYTQNKILSANFIHKLSKSQTNENHKKIKFTPKKKGILQNNSSMNNINSNLLKQNTNNSNNNIDDNDNDEVDEGNYSFDNYFKKILNSNSSNKVKTSQINSILGKTENIADLIIKDDNEKNNNIINNEENKEKTQKIIKKKLDIINETNEKN